MKYINKISGITGAVSFLYMLGLAGESDLGAPLAPLIPQLIISLAIFALSILVFNWSYEELQRMKRAARRKALRRKMQNENNF